MMKLLKLLAVFIYIIFFTSCSIQKKLGKSFTADVLDAPALQTAHVGISLFDAASGKYVYNYQGDKYFVPASNTKIPTCYAAMKYLGDSLIAGRFVVDNDGVIEIYPTADPTFLHHDFKFQPLFSIMKNYQLIRWGLSDWKAKQWGSGWAWNDYDASYMAERSPFPIYGNVLQFSFSGDTLKGTPEPSKIWTSTVDSVGYDYKTKTVKSKNFVIERRLEANDFYLKPSGVKFAGSSFAFKTDVQYISQLLKDTLHADNVSTFTAAPTYKVPPRKVIYSQPTDSLLKPMMHRSDNFFAEQSLLMVSNELLGEMNDTKIIDTILKTDFKDLEQKPRWADGSGLSRYNLFTPQSLVTILNKMKVEFGMERIKEVFPTGGEGTLSSLYKTDSTFIYAKTGTLSGVVALSGFLYTQKGKLLIFSVLVNNHQGSATPVRKAVETFIQRVRKEY